MLASPCPASLSTTSRLRVWRKSSLGLAGAPGCWASEGARQAKITRAQAAAVTLKRMLGLLLVAPRELDAPGWSKDAPGRIGSSRIRRAHDPPHHMDVSCRALPNRPFSVRSRVAEWIAL